MSAYVTAVPPKDSQQSKWFTPATGNVNWFTLTVTQGGVIDVEMDLVLQNGETPVQVSGSQTAGSVGEVAVRALDSGGSQDLVPVSYVTF